MVFIVLDISYIFNCPVIYTICKTEDSVLLDLKIFFLISYSLPPEGAIAFFLFSFTLL